MNELYIIISFVCGGFLVAFISYFISMRRLRKKDDSFSIRIPKGVTSIRVRTWGGGGGGSGDSSITFGGNGSGDSSITFGGNGGGSLIDD